MNRLIIVGNGFDLSYGLKSSYQHFFKEYLKSCIENPKEESLYILRHKYYGSAEIPKQIKFNYEKDISQIKDQILSNGLSIDYKGEFSEGLLNELSISNWVDLESLYFKFILRYTDSIKKINLSTDTNRINELVKKIEDIHIEFEIIKKELLLYLNSQEPKSKVDYDLLNEDIRKKFFTKFDYLPIPQIFTNNSLILNFNYTNYLKNIIENQDFSHQINIHGSADESLNNPIIFGYGDYFHESYKDIENLNIPEFLRFIKSMEYPKTNNYTTLLNFLDNGLIPQLNHNYDRKSILEFEVLIYGHSCGLSDRILLKTIFEHQHCKRIHVAFHNDIDDYFNKTIEISRHFDKKDEFLKKLQPFNEFLKIPQFSDYPLKDEKNKTYEVY